MTTSEKQTIEVRVERTIPATPRDVYDAWLDPEVPGTPWNESTKLVLNPTVDGLFYWRHMTTPHFGRFTELMPGTRIRHTWMSPNTSGRETEVTVTFAEEGEGTLMTLVHSGLPDTDGGRGHEGGWAYFLDSFGKRFAPDAPAT